MEGKKRNPLVTLLVTGIVCKTLYDIVCLIVGKEPKTGLEINVSKKGDEKGV